MVTRSSSESLVSFRMLSGPMPAQAACRQVFVSPRPVEQCLSNDALGHCKHGGNSHVAWGQGQSCLEHARPQQSMLQRLSPEHPTAAAQSPH